MMPTTRKRKKAPAKGVRWRGDSLQYSYEGPRKEDGTRNRKWVPMPKGEVTPPVGQFGGWDKLGSGCRHAAN